MAKYISQASGVLTEVQAATTGGGGDANKIPQLDGSGRLASGMMPAGLGADVGTIGASENLAAGDFVNVWNDGGTVKVRKADASAAGKEAHGFVLAAVTAPANATVYFEGVNNQLSALTGGNVFLSTTPGAVTQTAPSSAGNVVQRVGVAIAATEVNVEIQQPIVLA